MTDHETLSAIDARLRHIEATQKEHGVDLKRLLASEARREGREQATRRQDDAEWGDRWQVWVRALLPVGLLTAFFTAIIEAARNMWGGQ